MEIIYVLKDSLGWFCHPSISENTRTDKLALARQFNDETAAKIFADVKQMAIFTLQPVPV